ncbi:MAG: glucose-6-phosphate isomerase [Spirochaetota bacterium]
MSLQFRNLDTTDSYAVLQKLPVPGLHEILTTERVSACTIPAGGGLSFNYAALPVDNKISTALAELAEEQQLIDKYRALLDGERMNTGENRMVLHHLTRGQLGNAVEENGQDLRKFYHTQLERIASFSAKIHNGSIKGSTGKSFTTVVQIGIGGSDLGPRALYLSLKGYYVQPKMEARFISNVDPDDAAEVLDGLDLERTLFILVSKSGTTQETLTNQKLVYNYLSDKAPKADPRGHMLAVTSSSSPLAESDEFLDSFYIDDYIGGRYSSTSAVGATVLSLAFGADEFERLLKGAHSADRRALEPSFYDNAALADALMGVYLRNVLEYRVSAVLPYSQALVRFPAHLQQLDMESNGKQVSRNGEPLSYDTGPVIFGEPGTNGQHSFYQLLHQGTEKVALQFIGFLKNQRGLDLIQDEFSSRQKLNANLAAQIVAFAKGKQDENANKNFPGDRPSSLLYGDKLTPESLGALLAHFENKVMFQGFTWNVNSFDQEGVQLGKVLTKEVLGGEPKDASLGAYARLLGVL